MSAENLHLLRQRSNDFIANLNSHIGDVIEHNDKLINLNKAQLKAHKNAKDGSLVNLQTGSANLSPAYAKRKGKKKPDFFDTGDTFREMDLLFNEPKEWFITSYTDYTKHLVENYKDAFGISNKNKAKSITIPLMAKLYRRLVIK